MLIVDDHEFVRESLALFAETQDDIEIVGQATNGDEALRLCADLRPDVVLLDLSIPLIDGLTVLRVIRQMYPSVAVVMLSYSSKAEDIEAALEAGASAYLVKGLELDELAAAIRQAKLTLGTD
jgi:DNA-binding NarL/FixJ family response regulator